MVSAVYLFKMSSVCYLIILEQKFGVLGLCPSHCGFGLQMYVLVSFTCIYLLLSIHQLLRRTLVAIGTHDLDTIQAPFSYEVKNLRADELMEFYKRSACIMACPCNIALLIGSFHFGRTVLSLPPIINGAPSAITLKTTNVFIESTTTDLTKAKIVLITTVTALTVGYSLRFLSCNCFASQGDQSYNVTWALSSFNSPSGRTFLQCYKEKRRRVQIVLAFGDFILTQSQ